MRLVFALSSVVALLAVSVAAPAPRPTPAALIEKGLRHAVDAGWLTPVEAAGYRRDLAHGRAAIHHLPRGRVAVLKAVLEDVAAQWRTFTKPRALTLFSTLAFNTKWLTTHALVGGTPDAADED